MADCPTCEYHKKRAQIWRDEAYRLAGHPLPRKEKSMTQEEVVFMLAEAIDQDREYKSWHVSTKHLMTLAKLVAEKEREACAKVCEELERKATKQTTMVGQGCQACAVAIRARGQA